VDFYSLALAVVLAAAYLWFGAKTKWLPIVAAIFATAVVVVEGWILSVSAEHPSGRTAAPVRLLPRRVDRCDRGRPAGKSAGQAQGDPRGIACRVVVLSLIELVTVSYGGTPEAKEGMALLWSGGLAPFYWAALILGFVVPFVLLGVGRSKPDGSGRRGVLAIVGVFATKLAILVAGKHCPLCAHLQRICPPSLR